MIEDEKKAELLLTHHKETYDNILTHWNTRNRLFIYILIVLAFMALDTYKPQSISLLVNAYIVKSLRSEGQALESLDFSAIGSTVWFLLLSLTIQYYQRSLFIDRQYRFISHLEDRLCSVTSEDCFCREGNAYLSKTGVPSAAGETRPLYLRAVGPLYTIIFPVLLALFVGYKAFQEDRYLSSIFNWFNIIVAAAIILYNIFYLNWILRKK